MILIKLLIAISLIFCININVNAAEVLQVRSSRVLQIGDQNRNYTVEIACIDVDSKMEYDARTWLRSKLPRKTRVNLRPLSAENGVLVARVLPIGSTDDISKEMIAKGLAIDKCKDNN